LLLKQNIKRTITHDWCPYLARANLINMTVRRFFQTSKCSS